MLFLKFWNFQFCNNFVITTRFSVSFGSWIFDSIDIDFFFYRFFTVSLGVPGGINLSWIKVFYNVAVHIAFCTVHLDLPYWVSVSCYYNYESHALLVDWVNFKIFPLHTGWLGGASVMRPSSTWMMLWLLSCSVLSWIADKCLFMINSGVCLLVASFILVLFYTCNPHPLLE